MAENKTKPTEASVDDFIANLENSRRRSDALTALKIYKEVTGLSPVMWGPSIIGFGSYHYAYASGHEGDTCLTGFSPRSGALVVYLGPGIENEQLMSRLGKHKRGKGCLYINKLDYVVRGILRKLLEHSIGEMRKSDPTKKR